MELEDGLSKAERAQERERQAELARVTGQYHVMVHKQCHMGVCREVVRCYTCYCRLCMELENGMMSKLQGGACTGAKASSGAHARYGAITIFPPQ